MSLHYYLLRKPVYLEKVWWNVQEQQSAFVIQERFEYSHWCLDEISPYQCRQKQDDKNFVHCHSQTFQINFSKGEMLWLNSVLQIRLFFSLDELWVQIFFSALWYFFWWQIFFKKIQQRCHVRKKLQLWCFFVLQVINECWSGQDTNPNWAKWLETPSPQDFCWRNETKMGEEGSRAVLGIHVKIMDF